jgi:hypothetical protein
MRSSHTVGAVSVRFDDESLVSSAGIVPVMRLAEGIGLGELIEDRVDLGIPVGANSDAKALSIVAGMVIGADSIDDLDVIRHGAMPRLFDRLRAPSTCGSWLRGFTHGHVRQLTSVAGEALVRLAGQVPALLAGVDQLAFRALIDRELYVPKSWTEDRDRCEEAGIGNAARRRPPTHLLDHPRWVTLRGLEVARSHGSCPDRPRSPVTGVIPAGAHSHRWRLGFKQSSLDRIARILRHPAMDASRRPPLHRHALVPFGFPVQVSRSIQEQFLQVPPNCVGDTNEAPHGAHRTCPLSEHPAQAATGACGFDAVGFLPAPM